MANGIMTVVLLWCVAVVWKALRNLHQWGASDV